MLRRALKRTSVVSQRLRNTYIPQAENHEARSKVAQAEIQQLRSENEMLRNHADPGVQQEIDLQAQLDLRMKTAPRHPDDDPDLEPHEQDSSYGRTSATISSLSEKYRGMVTITNIDENSTLVNAAGGHIYTVKGDLMCMRDLVLSWRPPDNIQDWRFEHFISAAMVFPTTFLTVIGTGDSFERLPTELTDEFKRRGIPVEVSNSLNACSLYNLLCAEREGEGIILFSKRLSQPRYVFDPHNVHALQNTASAGERKRIQLSKQANKNVPAMAHPKYNK
ncbi:unnamed protein product [Oikopleura dioica]|uniref:NADH dehydrogenase [ubiquinone] 1 alpha subcomplex assembly factor 3 n=1 Tax=Oikopleura dioica TaxID=34765 RepID=E4X3M2_OIKDI|nr:unnamed protein product [Oikopleura dioica]